MSLPADIPTMDIHEPFATQVKYCHPTTSSALADLTAWTFPTGGFPPLEERLSWAVPARQRWLDESFLHGPQGLLTALHAPPRSLFQFPYWQVRDLAADTAKTLRGKNQHHQAFALEWVSDTAQTLSHDLYDIGEILGWNGTKQAMHLNRSDTAVLLFRDGDTSLLIATDDDGRILELDPHRTLSPLPHWVIAVDVITHHAIHLFTGAVLLDYLTPAGGDMEVAAVLSSLDN